MRNVVLPSSLLALIGGCFDQPTVFETGGSSGGVSGDLRVFVTGSDYDAGFGGPEAADQLCQGVADGAIGEGRWVAWISTAQVNAIDRVEGQGPWVRLDGETAFSTRAQLSTGPSVAVNVNAAGDSVQGPDLLAWTGTTVTGVASGNDCAGWTFNGSDMGRGTAGEVGRDDAGWTHADVRLCSTPRALYCFEAPD